ncbi:hypothetical protein GCM10027598_78850 [Amycolatopsis oliviviridis]|uniref:Uncharacterized protein n=1 Tax=Amycolatopsis oliviviridis TaxID=1471590 RepID=A0ABQ3L5X4_9PSEU|nr:hypothetical protein [Amycolatopsis oliviviridis]GHH05169.1 hypothetical protein GCM10017790_08780 [Amycolatopsis oliviviridis]
MSPDEKLAYVVTVMAETGAGPRVDVSLAARIAAMPHPASVLDQLAKYADEVG